MDKRLFAINKPSQKPLQESRILVCGQSDILLSCQQVLKNDIRWTGYFANNKDSLLSNVIQHKPDVVLIDLLMEGVMVDEIIKTIKSIPELKNTVILTYHTTTSRDQDSFAIRALMIEVEYMKTLTQEAGAREYLGIFEQETLLDLIDVYRKDF